MLYFDLHSRAWTRRKVQPMFTGLFSADDRPAVLETGARPVIFLTHNATHRVIRELP